MDQAVEKTRILEDALQSLAREHHRLERVSLSLTTSGSPVFFDVHSENGGTDYRGTANEERGRDDDPSDDCLSISSNESFHSVMDSQLSDGFSDMHVSSDVDQDQSSQSTTQVPGSNHVGDDTHGGSTSTMEDGGDPTTTKESGEEKNGKKLLPRSSSANFIIPGCHR